MAVSLVSFIRCLLPLAACPSSLTAHLFSYIPVFVLLDVYNNNVLKLLTNIYAIFGKRF